MSFSRLLSSSYDSFMAVVPTFVRRHPVAIAGMSLVAISYATPRLIRYFTNDDETDANDPRRLFRAMERFMMDRVCNVRETEDSLILRLNLFSSNVQKDEVDVTVDHNTLTVKDALPDRNQFSATMGLTGKNCDVVKTTAKIMESNVLEIVIPKLKNKEDEEDEDDLIVHVDVE